MIQKINEKQNILGDNIGFVENWDFSRANLNEENRILAITQVASICYQNPKALGSESLYNRLAAESQGLPSSSFEFVPVLLDTHKDRHKEILYDSHILSNIYKYGEEIANKYILTNYRAIYYDYEQKIKEIKEYYNSTVASPENDTNYHEDLKILKERYLGLFNTEEECEIIKEHFKVFLFKVDFPTRSQMVRHRISWQELCISGESKITTLQGKRTIKELYENQFRKSTNKLPKVRTYDFNEKRLVWSEIKEVFSTGKKQVFEVVIQTGKQGNKLRIKSTENHKFLTLDGWKELKDISVGGFVATNDHTYTFNFVESITLIGEEDTYDLEVEHPDHNYVANGIIVHNSRRYVSGKRVPFEYYTSEKLKGFSAEIGEESYDAEPIKTSIEDLIKYNENMYYALLDAGVKPQEARRVIPQSAYTQIWGAFMPNQLDNYFKLRLDKHAQWEIQMVSKAMQELINGRK